MVNALRGKVCGEVADIVCRGGNLAANRAESVVRGGITDSRATDKYQVVVLRFDFHIVPLGDDFPAFFPGLDLHGMHVLQGEEFLVRSAGSPLAAALS